MNITPEMLYGAAIISYVWGSLVTYYIMRKRAVRLYNYYNPKVNQYG